MQPLPFQPKDVSPDSALAGSRVLLVDDERDSLAILTAFLSLLGAEVVATVDATEALGALRRRSFDLVIADLGLPGWNGFDLLAAIRALPGRAGAIPVLAVTGRAGPIAREEALRAGFHAHVPKPVDLQALLAAMRSAAGSGGSGDPRGPADPGGPGSARRPSGRR